MPAHDNNKKILFVVMEYTTQTFLRLINKIDSYTTRNECPPMAAFKNGKNISQKKKVGSFKTIITS